MLVSFVIVAYNASKFLETSLGCLLKQNYNHKKIEVILVDRNSSDNTKKISSFLGKISYPLYISHYPIMYLFYMWLIRNKCYGLGDTLFAPMLVVILSVLLAYGLLKFYDEPVRKWLTNR